MEKKNCPNMEIFSGPYFLLFGLITKIFSDSVRKRENAYQTNIHMGHFSGSVSGQQTLWKKTLSSHLEKSIIEFFQWVILLEELSSRCSTEGLLTKFRMKTFVVDYTFRKQIHMVNKGPLTNGLDQG